MTETHPSPIARREVVLTGDRPTGPLHLGHFAGSLRTRLALQYAHDQTILIADLQALTDNAGRPVDVRRQVMELALDYLAVGIDPNATTIALQSGIPELAELTVLYLNLVTVARLERNPTVREEIALRGFESRHPSRFSRVPGQPGGRHHRGACDRCPRRRRPAPDDRADQRDRSAPRAPGGTSRAARVPDRCCPIPRDCRG